MPCEACGGDGQIEYGAYRGDNSTETRECRLCGGKATNWRAMGKALQDVGLSATVVVEAMMELSLAGQDPFQLLEKRNESTRGWAARLAGKGGVSVKSGAS